MIEGVIEYVSNFLVTFVDVVAIVIEYVRFFCSKTYTVHQSGIVVITGASTGIGRHAAEHLAQKHKSYVVLAGVRRASDAESIQDMGIANLRPIIVDVTDHDSVVRAVDEVKALMEKTALPLIALVNNAGIAMTGPFEFLRIESIRQMFDINYFGVIDLTQQVLPLLQASKGRIINISSMAGVIVTPLYTAYSASKFALEALSDGLRREVAQFGISVSVVQPAHIITPIMAKGLEAFKDGQPYFMSKNIHDEEFQSLYSRYYDEKARKKTAQALSISPGPIVTSIVIEDAIVSATPRIRYTVAKKFGLPSEWVRWIVWALSNRMQDALLEAAT